jgi:hypothetical protein
MKVGLANRTVAMSRINLADSLLTLLSCFPLTLAGRRRINIFPSTLNSNLSTFPYESPFHPRRRRSFWTSGAQSEESAQWFQRALGLRKEFEFDDGVAVGNDNVTIVLFKGKPSPKTLGHMSFHLPNMATPRKGA